MPSGAGAGGMREIIGEDGERMRFGDWEWWGYWERSVRLAVPQRFGMSRWSRAVARKSVKGMLKVKSGSSHNSTKRNEPGCPRIHSLPVRVGSGSPSWRTGEAAAASSA